MFSWRNADILLTKQVLIANIKFYSFHEILSNCILFKNLTLSWRRPLSYRNQSTDLQSKSMDWFLYDNSLRHERNTEYGHFSCSDKNSLSPLCTLLKICNLVPKTILTSFSPSSYSENIRWGRGCWKMSSVELKQIF